MKSIEIFAPFLRTSAHMEHLPRLVLQSIASRLRKKIIAFHTLSSHPAAAAAAAADDPQILIIS
uniref:Uncharacterized protein n=1 Tax=Candidozyma auris TaxID=498019 RepID=A0A0L0NXM7_CANAR